MSEREPVNRQERRKREREERGLTKKQRKEAARLAAIERGQVTPNELIRGKTYIIPSHGGDHHYKIVSVGRKWIKARITNEGDRVWMVLKSGWDGPYFLELKE